MTAGDEDRRRVAPEIARGSGGRIGIALPENVGAGQMLEPAGAMRLGRELDRLAQLLEDHRDQIEAELERRVIDPMIEKRQAVERERSELEDLLVEIFAAAESREGVPGAGPEVGALWQIVTVDNPWRERMIEIRERVEWRRRARELADRADPDDELVLDDDPEPSS